MDVVTVVGLSVCLLVTLSEKVTDAAANVLVILLVCYGQIFYMLLHLWSGIVWMACAMGLMSEPPHPLQIIPRYFRMMTTSNGNIFRVTGPLCGEFTGHRWIPRTKASEVFFDLRLNIRLCKQSWGWWFETLSGPLCRHSNAGEHFKWLHTIQPIKDLFWHTMGFSSLTLGSSHAVLHENKPFMNNGFTQQSGFTPQWHHMNLEVSQCSDIPLFPGQQPRNHQRSALLGICEGNPLVNGGFPSQRASNAEIVSISWHHHDIVSIQYPSRQKTSNNYCNWYLMQRLWSTISICG